MPLEITVPAAEETFQPKWLGDLLPGHAAIDEDGDLMVRAFGDDGEAGQLIRLSNKDADETRPLVFDLTAVLKTVPIARYLGPFLVKFP